jgi:hypothetical protein
MSATKFRPWTEAEVEAFAALYTAGKSLKACCISFGRTEEAALKQMQLRGYVTTVHATRGGRPRNMTSGREAVEVARLPNEPPGRGDTDEGCRWLLGAHSGRNFCGEAKVPGSSWCVGHHSRAYRRQPNGSA